MGKGKAYSVCLLNRSTDAVAEFENSSRISKDGTGVEHLIMHFNVRPQYSLPSFLYLTDFRSRDLSIKE
jgi:hypothetical protein